jgi:hypothetical protein
VVVTAKYTTFAKYNRSKRFLSPYAMLPNVSNIDIAKSKRPTHELIVAACYWNSENWEGLVSLVLIVMHIGYSITFETGVYFISLSLRALFEWLFPYLRFKLYYRWTLTFTISGIVSIQLINCRNDVWKFMYKQNDFINTRVVCWVAKFMSQSHSCASSAHGQFYNSQIFRKSGISRHTGHENS